MCGISGILGKKASRELVEKMSKTQEHRGPDYTGFYIDDAICLAHNRLSIIDLSERSNQPFTDPKGRYHLVFNGEIYNYTELIEELSYDFRTHSDTEVLLAAYIQWGKDCLHKLNGMFSFAIWDTEKKKLFAARDRFGVKPFFYHFSDSTLYFASEIKAIHNANIEKKPNKKVWANYMAFGSYGMPQETFWDNIVQLAGGHFLEFEENTLNVQKWYYFEREIAKYEKDASYEVVKKRYTALLEDSIKLRFRADVNIGFNISGGLDSSTLLAFVNKNNDVKNIKAFTFYTDDERYDELPWVREMIKLTNNPLQEVLLASNEVVSLSEKISKHQDEPFGGIPTLAYSKLFEQARKEDVLVLLDGQGMDEQWAGYDYYLDESERTIQGIKGGSAFRQNVLSDDFLKLVDKPKYPQPFQCDLLNKQFRDLFYTKIPRALRFNDRISMAYSTELREPFLDYRLVEYAFSQPREFKIQNGVQKKMLRDIVSEHLSDIITHAPKRPLQTPQREWLGKDLVSFVDRSISNIEKSEMRKWFKMDALKEEWKKYQKGEQSSSFHIWQWINLSLLLEE